MAKIGVFDSGVGGLSVLKELLRALPDEDYVYYADSRYCPYGGQPADYVISRAVSITDTLLAEGCQLIVVACNTATSAAISFLREKYSIPFVGMEPAVKPAALETMTGVIGVLATAGTLSGSKYLNMKGKYSSEVKVVEHTGSGFVEIVERMAATGGEMSRPEETEVMDTICESLKPLVDADADSIVLGCTHYPFLLPQLEKAAAEICPQRHIHFINPAPAIARRVAELLSKSGSDNLSDSSVIVASDSVKNGVSPKNCIEECVEKVVVDGDDNSAKNSLEDKNAVADPVNAIPNAVKNKPEPSVKLLSSGSVDNLVTAFNHLCRQSF